MTALVKEWMSAEPVWVAPEVPALEALGRMLERGIRHLPVLDGARRVVGVLSIDDLGAALPFADSRRAVRGGGRAELAGHRVGDLMTFAPYTVREETLLEEAAGLLAKHRIGCLPVVESDGGLVGMLSETDALRALAGALWAERARSERDAGLEEAGLVDRLRAERARIASSLPRYAEVEREFTAHPGEQPVDFSERASDQSEVERAAILRSLAEQRLEKIDHALARAGEGRLAVCESCGGAIPLARLQVLPGTSSCVACARKLEAQAG